MTTGRKLLILDGVHAGAELFLAEGTYILGADLGCDMVLLDLGVDKQHLRLHVRDNGVVVERLGDAMVTLHGGPVAEKTFFLLDGDIARLGTAAFSVTTIGAVPLELVNGPDANELEAETEIGSTAPETTVSPRRSRLRRALSLILIIGVAGAGVFFGTRALEASVLLPVRAGMENSLPMQLPVLPGTEAKVDFVARVREFIADDALQVQQDGNGRVVVSGETKKGIVREQLQQIRKEYAGAIEIVDRVAYVLDKTKPNNVPMPQRVTDVSVGRVSWFQTADGARNYEGSKMADGAEVVRIGLESIVFRRDGKLTVFRLNDKEKE